MVIFSNDVGRVFYQSLLIGFLNILLKFLERDILQLLSCPFEVMLKVVFKIGGDVELINCEAISQIHSYSCPFLGFVP